MRAVGHGLVVKLALFCFQIVLQIIDVIDSIANNGVVWLLLSSLLSETDVFRWVEVSSGCSGRGCPRPGSCNLARGVGLGCIAGSVSRCGVRWSIGGGSRSRSPGACGRSGAAQETSNVNFHLLSFTDKIASSNLLQDMMKYNVLLIN